MRMRMARVLMLICAVAALPGLAQADALDDLMRQEMQARRIPGLSLAVVKDGALLQTRAYGHANLELMTPATVDTVYGIGSITKSFTALAVMMLVEDGRVNLDAAIGQYVKATPRPWRKASVRQLLSHTSGIPDFVDNPCRHTGPADYRHEDVLAEAACLPLSFPSGERFAYSNTNYLLLGMMVEAVTGARLGALFDARIDSKLGMSRTRMTDAESLIPARADGYVWDKNGYIKVEAMDPVVEFASGGLVSTAGDMAKFLLALGDVALLPAPRWQEMWSRAPIRSGTTAYGLGFGLTPYEGHARVGHNGAAPGFASALSWFPDERVGVVLLSNGYQEPFQRNVMDLANQVAALYMSGGKGDSPASVAATGYTAPAFELRACPEVPGDLPMRCGIVQVPENYAKPEGRRIALKVLVLSATNSKQKRVAQYDLEGGPGYDATFFLGFYATEGAAYRASRDIILADMRGTGDSHPLRCAAIEAYQQRNPLAPLYPPELVADCVRQLSATSDLGAYSTANAARDIDSVRKALGYEQLVLNAVSYGTTLAMRYIADFPERARSAVFVGTVPADRTPPRYHAAAASRALAMVMADCSGDKRCSSDYPDVAGDLKRTLARLDKADAPMSRAVMMEQLRVLMYTATGQRQVPFVLHQAAQGDFKALTPSAQQDGDRPFADGLYLAITCAETFARIDLDAAIGEAVKTDFGAYRLQRQAAACRQWPQSLPDAQLMKQGRFQTPVLFIAGDRDPVSPPQWASDAVKMFPNGRLQILPNGAHVVDGLSGLDTCFDPLVIAFFERGSATGLDLSCMAHMLPPPYRTAAQP